MADDEFLSDDDYVPVPLKEVARHELHPAGTEARIRELEAENERLLSLTIRWTESCTGRHGSQEQCVTLETGGEHEAG